MSEDIVMYDSQTTGKPTTAQAAVLEQQAAVAKGLYGPANERQVGGSHYKDMALQPWDVMETVLTHEEFVGFLKGCVIKHSMRHGRKEGTDDAGKAKHYKQKLAEVVAKVHRP